MRRVIKNYNLMILLLIAMIIATIILMIFNPYKKSADMEMPEVENGILNLSGWDFSKNGNIKLDGNWEFYWNQLIMPGDFTKQKSQLTGLYPVPLYWTKYKALNLPARGVATYRIVIDTDKTYKSWSIKTPEIYTEYCLWINGEAINRHGSFNGSNFRYLKPDVYTFSNETHRIEIVLQIKNQAHINAGIGQSFVLGTPENIYRERNAGTAVDLSICAICMFAGLYHFILFAYKKEDYNLLCFAIFCIAVSARGIMSNETYIMQLFPEMSFLIGSKVITSLIPIITVSVLFYTYFMYRNEMPNKLMWALIVINGVYLLVVLVSSPYVYSTLFNYYLISVAAACFLILYASVRSIINGNREAVIFLAGAVFVVIGAFNDMLYFNQWINTGYWLALGLAVFTVAQSVMLAMQFSRLFNEKQSLYEKLCETDLAFMQAQIKPHFIYNALSAISNMTTKDPKRAKELLLDFSDYLRGCFNFENINGMTTLSTEMEIVKAYLSIEKARFRERLHVEFHVNESPYALIPMLCIQPIVENAVRHGLMDKMAGGTVKISVWNEQGDTHIRIEDNGVGIPEDKLTNLLNGATTCSVGINNVNNRLKLKFGRGIMVSSRANEGTTVEMVIPQDYTGIKGEVI